MFYRSKAHETTKPSEFVATEKDNKNLSTESNALGARTSAPLPIQTSMKSNISSSPSSFASRRGSPHMFPSFGMLVNSPWRSSFDDQGLKEEEFDTSEMIHFLNQGAK